MKDIEFYKKLQDKITSLAVYNNYLVTFTVHPKPLPYAKNGLTITDYIIVWNLDRLGASKMSDIAKKHSIKPYQMSRIVEKLVNKGYINRYKKEGNFKTLYLELTAQGKALLEENKKEVAVRLKSNLDDVTDNQGIEKFFNCYDLLYKTYNKLLNL